MPLKHTVTVYNKTPVTMSVSHKILLGKSKYEFPPMVAVEIPYRAWTNFRYRYNDWMVTGEPVDINAEDSTEQKRRGRPRKADNDVNHTG